MFKNDKAHLTAITRKTLSKPTRWLFENGYLNDGINILDYGCGKGFDADTLGFYKYDPYYFPSIIVRDKLDLIICNYVLNVVKREEREKILNNIFDLLKSGGKAYITVRRDIKKNGYTSRGTYQEDVYLDSSYAVSIRRTSTYEIYILQK